MLARMMLCTALSLLSAATACSREPSVARVTPAQVEALRAQAAAPVLLDVRSQEEFDAGHIPGAIHIPHTDLASRIGEVPRSQAGVVVYCQKGPRAAMGEQTLLERGFSSVMHLEDGFSAWHASGLPVEGLGFGMR